MQPKESENGSVPKQYILKQKYTYNMNREVRTENDNI